MMHALQSRYHAWFLINRLIRTKVSLVVLYKLHEILHFNLSNLLPCLQLFWQVNIESHHLYQWQKYRIIYLHLPLLSK